MEHTLDARGRMVLDWVLERRAHSLAARLSPHLPGAGPVAMGARPADPGSAPKPRVLDIGSGTGHNAQALRALGRLTVDEVDVCDMHRVGPGPDLFNGRTLPYPEGHFACATILFVLQYVEDPAAFLGEAARVTAGPLLVIQSTCEGALGQVLLRGRGYLQGRGAFRLARGLGFVAGSGASLDARRCFTRAGFRAAAEQAGLHVEHVEPEPWFGLPVSRDLSILRKSSILRKRDPA